MWKLLTSHSILDETFHYSVGLIWLIHLIQSPARVFVMRRSCARKLLWELIDCEKSLPVPLFQFQLTHFSCSFCLYNRMSCDIRQMCMSSSVVLVTSQSGKSKIIFWHTEAFSAVSIFLQTWKYSPILMQQLSDLGFSSRFRTLFPLSLF